MPYHIINHKGDSFGVDSSGYFTDKESHQFEDTDDGAIKVLEGSYTGYYLGASGDHGYVMAYTSKTTLKSPDCGPWTIGHLEIDCYEGSYYCSGRWFEKRDHVFHRYNNDSTVMSVAQGPEICIGTVDNAGTSIDQEFSVTYSRGFSDSLGSTKSLSFTAMSKSEFYELSASYGESQTTTSASSMSESITIPVKAGPGKKVRCFVKSINLVTSEKDVVWKGSNVRFVEI